MTLPEDYKPYCPSDEKLEIAFTSPTAKRVPNERGNLVWRSYIELAKPTKIKKLKMYFAKRGYIKIDGIKPISKPKRKRKMKDLLV